MSQLIDLLTRVAKAAPQPMGFHTARPAPVKSQLLLIPGVKADDLPALAERLSGADAVLVCAANGTKAMQKAVKPLRVPWGVWYEQAGAKEAAAYADAGADFLVFPPDSSVSAMPTEKVGKVLRITPSLAVGLMGAIDDLALDAVLVTGDSGESLPLTWRALMFLQRVGSLAKPLLVAVQSKLTASELEALWAGGVDGIVVEVSPENAAGLKELRETIAGLSLSTRRKRGHTNALVPSIRPEAEPEEVEEEEEDD